MPSAPLPCASAQRTVRRQVALAALVHAQSVAVEAPEAVAGEAAAEHRHVDRRDRPVGVGLNRLFCNRVLKGPWVLLVVEQHPVSAIPGGFDVEHPEAHDAEASLRHDERDAFSRGVPHRETRHREVRAVRDAECRADAGQELVEGAVVINLRAVKRGAGAVDRQRLWPGVVDGRLQVHRPHGEQELDGRDGRVGVGAANRVAKRAGSVVVVVDDQDGGRRRGLGRGEQRGGEDHHPGDTGNQTLRHGASFSGETVRERPRWRAQRGPAVWRRCVVGVTTL